LITGGGGRRRSTFLAGRNSGAHRGVAIKVGPLRWQQRGSSEQLVLHRIQALGDLAEAAPRPLGQGAIGRVYWSAESAVLGRPLPDVLGSSLDAVAHLDLLEDLATWFTRLAALTRTTRSWTDGVSALPLRGEHRRLQPLREALRAVPGVLVHGDVGTAGNVLLAHNAFSIIDWETAAEAELPLTDLIPLLCTSLAVLRGHRGAPATAQFILRLCAGGEGDSGWFLALVRRYCRELDVPLDQVGKLAALAWGYHASMRLVHQELVVESGGVAPEWHSPFDEIARVWLSHPGLGEVWPALSECRLN
jgi:hypothetical protein